MDDVDTPGAYRDRAGGVGRGLSAREAVAGLRLAISRGDEDRVFAVALEVRDRLREALGRGEDLAAAWLSCPAGLDARWFALLAAFVSREFENAGFLAPRWAATSRLETAWVLDTPRLTDAEIRAQTPAWLEVRNIFIAAKDLGTL